MTSVLTGIDAKIDSRCLTAALNKQGCEVGSEGLPALWRVIDMDHPNAPVERARKCDYLLLAEESNPWRLLVMPLELKSTGLDPASVQSQLQAGAQAAEGIVAGISSPTRFVPVAVHGRGKMRRRTFKELHKKRIQFRSGEFQIMTMNCGDQLIWALE